MAVQDIQAQELIERTAKRLTEIEQIKAPNWAPFVKTGNHKQRPPVNPNWWYVRAASVLRKIYLLGPVGTAKLRRKYGGRKNRGVAADSTRSGSGNIIRKILQQLEVAGLAKQVVKGNHKGRVITPKGLSILEKK